MRAYLWTIVREALTSLERSAIIGISIRLIRLMRILIKIGWSLIVSDRKIANSHSSPHWVLIINGMNAPQQAFVTVIQEPPIVIPHSSTDCMSCITMWIVISWIQLTSEKKLQVSTMWMHIVTMVFRPTAIWKLTWTISILEPPMIRITISVMESLKVEMRPRTNSMRGDFNS